MAPLELIFVASGMFTFSGAVYLVVATRFRSDAVACLLAMGGWTALALGIAFYDGGEFQPFRIGRYVFAAAAPLIPALWLVFTTLWGRDPRERKLKGGRLAGLIGAFAVSGVLIAAGLTDPRYAFSPGPLLKAHFTLGQNSFLLVLFYLAGFLFGLYDIENTYRTALGSQKRRLQGGARLLMLITGLVLVAGTIEVLFDRIPFWVLVVAAAAAPLLTAALARHLVRNDPSRIGVVVTRHSAYSSIVIMAGAAFFFLVGVLAHLLESLEHSLHMLIPVLAAALVVLLFMTIYLGGRLYHGRRRGGWSESEGRESSEIRNFLEEVSILKEAGGVYEVVRVHLKANYDIDAVAFLELSEPQSRYHVSRPGRRGAHLERETVEPMMEWLHRLGRPILFEDLIERAAIKGEHRQTVQERLGFVPKMLVPLISRQNLVAVLAVGSGSTEQIDLGSLSQFLEVAAGPLALAIYNSRMTDQLIRAREMESFHRISSFVLHDLKNSVGMLDLLLVNARRRMDNPEFRASILTTIEDAVARQRRIISKLSDPSERAPQKTSVDINALLKEVIDKVQVRSIERLELAEEYGELPMILTDPPLLRAVMENLIVNAVEAMPVGGRLAVGTAAVRASDGTGGVAITVEDTGVGMSPEFVEKKLFQPFVSTKKKGLGIGMFQAREAIAQLGGEILVWSRRGKGTRFQIRLAG